MKRRNFLSYSGIIIGALLSPFSFADKSTSFMLRKANQRGGKNHGWLNTKHTFSFAQYYDPRFMGFHNLRVINEDKVAPAAGFGRHKHRDMEIVSFVISGELKHKDSAGNEAIIKAGEIQKMTAGSGIFHSEFNNSKTKEVHFLQIWLKPNQKNLNPNYAQKRFSPEKQGQTLLASSTKKGLIQLNADADISYMNFTEQAEYAFLAKRSGNYWIHMLDGDLTVNGVYLTQGDGFGIKNQQELILYQLNKARFLLFELA